MKTQLIKIAMQQYTQIRQIQSKRPLTQYQLGQLQSLYQSTREIVRILQQSERTTQIPTLH